MKFKGFSIGFIAFALLACTAIANDSRHGLTYEKESQHLEQVREEMKSEFKKSKSEVAGIIYCLPKSSS